MLRRAVLGDEKDASKPHVDGLADKYPFEAIAEYLRTKLPYHDLAEWLREEGGFAAARPRAAHQSLRELYELVPHRFPKTVFTTNFDTLIEDVFGDAYAHCITSENVAELQQARKEGKIAVVHLHGCTKYPKSIISGERQLATLEGPVFDLLRGALAIDIFVLVGYSLRDTNLRDVFFDVQRVADTRLGLKKRTFAVSPEEGHSRDETDEAGIAKTIWKLRDVDHIAASAVGFFQSVFSAAENVLTIEMRDEVAKALGKDAATLDKMLESAAQPIDVIKPIDLLVYLHYSLSLWEKK